MRPHHDPSDSKVQAVDPEKTKFVVSSLARAVVWSGALIVFGYTMAIAISDFKNAQAEAFLRVDTKMLQLQTKVDKLHDEVALMASNSWTVQDTKEYLSKFRWENRNSPLVVPDPVKSKNP